MAQARIDYALLASHLANKLEQEQLTLRRAAEQVGCSPATLSRLLKGNDAPNLPDTATVLQAVSWLNRRISDFEHGAKPTSSSMADVEVHLRALPGLSEFEAEALVAMVRAAHDAALRNHPIQKSKRIG